MGFRNRLLPRVLRSGLMLSAAMTLTTAVADADVAMMLQPDSNWAVSKIGGGTTAGGGAYCALARRYSNGTVLTLARNASDESSMAIDFQRDGLLDPGASYNVTLKPGDGQDRNFNVHPVSGRALVVRLGKDNPFYDALSRAPVLNIDVGSNSYAFSMTNFDSGAQQIGTCLAGLNGAPTNALPVLAVAPPPAPVTAEITPVPDFPLKATARPAPEQVADDDAADNLRAQNDELKASLTKARRELAGKSSNAQKSSSAEMVLNDKLQELQQENDALRQQTNAPAADDMKQLKDQNALLLQQLDAMRVSSATPPPPPAAPQEFSAADAQMVNAQGHLAAANSKMDDADLRLADAEKRLAALEPAAGGPSDADRKLADANAKLDLANRKMAAADQKLSAADQKLIEATQKASQINDALAAGAAEGAAADQKMASAAQVMDQAKAKSAAADAKLAEAVQKTQIADQKTAADAQHEADAGQKLSIADQRLEDATAKLTAANQKLAEAQIKVAAADQSGRAAQASAMQQLAVAQAKMQDADRRMADADMKLQDAGRRLAAADQDKAETQRLAAAQTKLQQADTKLTQAGQGLAAADLQPSPTADLAKREAAADAKLTLAAQKLEEANRKLAAAQLQMALAVEPAAGGPAVSPDAKLAEAAQKQTLAEQRATEAETRAQAAEQKAAAATETIQGLRQQLALDAAIVAAGRQAAPGGQIVASLQTQIKALQADNAALKQQLASAATPSKTVADAAPTFDPQALQAVTDQLSEVTTERDQLRAQLKILSQNGGGDHLLKLSALVRPAKLIKTRAPAPVPRAKPADLVAIADNGKKPAASKGDVAKVVASTASPQKLADAGIDKASPAAPDSRFFTASELIHLLGPGGSDGDVKTVKGAPGVAVLHWRAGDLLGSAEQRLSGETAFDAHVAAYLAQAKKNCGGSFAANAGPAQTQGGGQAASYEIACVAQPRSAGASLLFYSRDGVFTTIAYEGALDAMDGAMDMRDHVLSQLLATRIAMN